MSVPFDAAYQGRPVGRFLPNPKLRFLDQCREVLRFKQMSYRTEEAYVDWIRRFIVWSGKRHPREIWGRLRCGVSSRIWRGGAMLRRPTITNRLMPWPSFIPTS